MGEGVSREAWCVVREDFRSVQGAALRKSFLLAAPSCVVSYSTHTPPVRQGSTVGLVVRVAGAAIVGVRVAVGAIVGVRVAVAVAVRVAVGATVGVRVAVGVAVRVSVAVGVRVTVAVRVAVTAPVGVRDGVGVAVADDVTKLTVVLTVNPQGSTAATLAVPAVALDRLVCATPLTVALLAGLSVPSVVRQVRVVPSGTR
ncbi:MAG: hypothetical protein CVU38_21575 [Chloroflexi bacterium HGW-Chloroflexi-1]|nr:MAG: hypothetical protein CVU38_21575 [Chloroflexi bacterium HGW-Chloroflexi-1]